MLKAILFNDTSYNKHHGCQIVVRQIYALAAGRRVGSRAQAQQMFADIAARVTLAHGH